MSDYVTHITTEEGVDVEFVYVENIDPIVALTAEMVEAYLEEVLFPVLTMEILSMMDPETENEC